MWETVLRFWSFPAAACCCLLSRIPHRPRQRNRSSSYYKLISIMTEIHFFISPSPVQPIDNHRLAPLTNHLNYNTFTSCWIIFFKKPNIPYPKLRPFSTAVFALAFVWCSEREIVLKLSFHVWVFLQKYLRPPSLVLLLLDVLGKKNIFFGIYGIISFSHFTNLLLLLGPFRLPLLLLLHFVPREVEGEGGVHQEDGEEELGAVPWRNVRENARFLISFLWALT